MDKQRLDVSLVSSGLCESREKAQALIMAGAVTVNGVSVTKAGASVKSDDVIRLKESNNPFVSRGGLKLQKAVDSFGLDLTDAVAIDVGSSTGGFTDCMLQHGAKLVYALDVGHGQLDWRLRNDERVRVMERRNARSMEPSWFDITPNYATMDVSFISIRLILPPLFACTASDAVVMSLIKPQFEAGREKVGKNGVVRSAETHIEVIERCADAAEKCGFSVDGLDYSPVTGPKGNIEYLMLLTKGARFPRELSRDVRQTVETAHIVFDAP